MTTRPAATLGALALALVLACGACTQAVTGTAEVNTLAEDLASRRIPTY